MMRKTFCGEIMITKKEIKTMKVGKGRFINRPSKTGKKLYDRFFVYIPTYVARDKEFPFKTGEEVVVKIQKGKLIIEKS
jgi:hypothetical protein